MKSVFAAFLIACIARPALADMMFFPSHFNLDPYFEACIPATEANERCTAVGDAFTLRREIGLAFVDCAQSGQATCEAAFKKAGLPEAALDGAILAECSPLPDTFGSKPNLLEPSSCIEMVAMRIEREELRTTHFTEISCGLHYIECAEMTSLSLTFWEARLEQQIAKHLRRTASQFESDPAGRETVMRLTKRRIELERQLARVKCDLEALPSHWNDALIVEGCRTQANIELWQTLRSGMPE